MKAVFVIDIPSELDVNDLLIDYCAHTKGEYKTIRKGGNHPIKPLPKRMIPEMVMGNKFAEGCVHGWNACLDAITGETE